jgi:hypothetical protein
MDDANITLPSGLSVQLKPMTGRAEKALEDKNARKNGSIVDRYMMECVETIGDTEKMTPQQKEKALLDMLSGDRNYLLLMIRMEAFGPEMIFEHECPNCKKTSIYKTNLQEMLDDQRLAILPYGENPRTIHLPVSGGSAEIVHMTGVIERQMVKLPEGAFHATMLLRIASIDGRSPTLKDLENMRGRDLLALRSAMSEMKGGLDSTFELDCLECGNSYETGLPGIRDFLFPMRTNTESAGA